ncbi:MAG TPA: hypothetical protein VFN09_11250 [Rhodanobacteraceae bacterium]|nr:hypothetical protein [Rhodanobacteraceae bacterium]
MWRPLIALLLLIAAAPNALAATTVRLPAGTCAADDSLFFDGFQGPVAVPADPSQGSGASQAGDVTTYVYVSGLGDRPDGRQTVYLRVPPGYTSAHAWPLVIALHGASGSHQNAVYDAKATRTKWAPLADAQGFILVTPVGNGQQGSWIVGGNPDDYDGFDAILAMLEANYNIERSRVYLWGFSAGGHVAWDLAFNGVAMGTQLNVNSLAGMAAAAGELSAFACNPQAPGQCANLVAAQSRRLPIDVHIGLSDPGLAHAQYDRNLLLANGWRLGTTLGYHEFVGDHEYTPPQLGEAWAEICRFARGP